MSLTGAPQSLSAHSAHSPLHPSLFTEGHTSKVVESLALLLSPLPHPLVTKGHTLKTWDKLLSSKI